MKATLKELDYTDEEVEEMLDQMYSDVEICGMTYSSGRALKELDPTAFRCCKLDLEDSQSRDNPIWVCSECGNEYSWEEEANECCREES